jgi:asparagine synthase (glutamine-hydrolysing)
MCGIAGVVAYRDSAPPIDRGELTAIHDAMAVRGPDGEGVWIAPDGRAALSHRRLAIIDLSPTGAQPMASIEGRLQITFNGEIYNYRELRRELVAKGFRFHSTSDTEVLLNLYLDRGAAMVESLRGMYTFGIWDTRDQSLFLARDPFGIKPLYYADDGSTLRFASQVKALVKGGHVDTTPSAPGHVGFYLWGHVPDPHTLYRGIRAVPAGSTMLVDRNGAHAPRAFFNVADEMAAAGEKAKSTRVSWQEACEEVRVALKDSVRAHLVADVPVGVFLSSGVDSTTLTALATEVGQGNIHTVTLGFDEYRGTGNDEAPLAEVVARRFGAQHETRWVSKSDFQEELTHIIDAMDQPSIDGVNTFFVSRAAAAAGMKVAMSGVGGDELFGSYPSFREIPAMTKLLGIGASFPRLGAAFRYVSAPLVRHLTSPKYAGLLEYGGTFGGAYLLRRGLFMPWELPGIMDPDLAREGLAELDTRLRLDQTVAGIESNFQKVSALELSWYMRNQLLRDSDWAGMAHSLEIRVPFVDVNLFRTVAPLMVKVPVSKRMVASAPNVPLPPKVVEKPKTGFSVPVRDWLAQRAFQKPMERGLRGWAQLLNPPMPRKTRILALTTDAFGGHGGIAKFNRDFLIALCSHDRCKEVIAIPRLMAGEPEPLPPKLTYLTAALNNKLKFGSTVLSVLSSEPLSDVVFCCHINLLPLAWFASVVSRARLVLVIHGIDAWQPTRSVATNFLARRVGAFVSVSALTKERFVKWSGAKDGNGMVLPNSVDLSYFRPAPRSEELVRRYGLHGKRVIMTMGRLVSAERYKGFDEVLEILPRAIELIPNLVYMIVGEGNDRARLERKAEDLGVREHVVFTGFISEEEKCDHFNLAEAFVMPSRGEGFGIVFLEAMACGVPVIGSAVDGSREALLDGALGALVDPDNPDAILDAIMRALEAPKEVDDGLSYFSFAKFEERVHRILDKAAA